MGRLRFWHCGRCYDIPGVRVGLCYAERAVADLGARPRVIREEEPLYAFDVEGDPVVAFWYEHNVWGVLARHGDELVLFLVDAPDAHTAASAVWDGVEVIGVQWALFLPPTCPVCWGQGVLPNDDHATCGVCMGTGHLDREVRLEVVGTVDSPV